MSMIGARCGIHISRHGHLHCAGRIILNDQVMLQTQGKGVLSIGQQFYINRYSRIVAHQRIEIGNNVTIGQMVTILDHDHHYTFEGENLKLSGYDTAPVKIGSNVWIADKVTILKGVIIGNNVVIAANALINKDIPDNSVVGGVPGKILKSL
jgi:maltose O-acetyltransferase